VEIIKTTKETHMRVRPSAIVIENSHVLLLRYHYGGQDVFALPGGNPDTSETLPQTIVRELREELNIETEVGQMLMAGEVIAIPPKEDVLHCVFETKIVGGLPILNPNETTALEIVWKPISSLSALNLYPNVGHYIATSVGGYLGKIEQRFF